jgi:hypothetical protein
VQLLLLLAIGVCLRLAFINQAFQLDDYNYLAGARYVQADPWHPANASFVFLGERVNMRGHPHPPFDSWFLGLALKLTGGESEAPLHAVYILFTLMSVAAMYALARRFTSRPVFATLLFMVTPAFVVHGNGLESDLPLVALWLVSAAAFIYAVDRDSKPLLALACISLALATLAAYQAVLLGPVLAVYAWMRKRDWRAAAAACAVPVIVIAGYQLYEAVSGGALPVAALMSNLRQGNYQSAANKWKNALALTAHLGWIVCPLAAFAAFGRFSRGLWVVVAIAAGLGAVADPSPLFWISIGAGAAVLLACATGLRDSDRDSVFLRVWTLLFFGGALVIFFAGAARYLLPLAAALALLTARALQHRPRWLAVAVLLQIPISLALAVSHYEHSGAYREFMRELALRISAQRTFINGEWGFQYYGQKFGAQPLLRDTELKPGDLLLTSNLGFPVPPRLAPGAMRKLVQEVRVVPAVPFRVIAVTGHSAFSSIAFGVRPFDVGRGPSDILTVEEIGLLEPALVYLPMQAPEAADQIVSGIYGLEDGRWRWMSGRAVILLKRPEGAPVFELDLNIPPSAPARRVTVAIGGVEILQKTLAAPGSYTLTSGAVPASAGPAIVTITVDKTFFAPGDNRELGVILNGAGFKPAR